MHRLSTLPEACFAFTHFVEARLPRCLTRLRLGSLRALARGFAATSLPLGGILVPLLLDVSRHHAGNRATLWLSGC